MRVRTLPYADLLVHGEEALVLLAAGPQKRGQSPFSAEEQGGTIARLSAIGVAVLRLAADGIGFDELANALEARFGTPSGTTTTDALAAILDALAAQQLVDLSQEEGSEE